MPAGAGGGGMGRHEEEESATLVTQEQPKSSCTTYLAEGDRLYRVQEYKKAIESYTAVSHTLSKGVEGREEFEICTASKRVRKPFLMLLFLQI